MISYYQKLSEKFIREFKWKVDWICISKNKDYLKDSLENLKIELIGI